MPPREGFFLGEQRGRFLPCSRLPLRASLWLEHALSGGLYNFLECLPPEIILLSRGGGERDIEVRSVQE